MYKATPELIHAVDSLLKEMQTSHFFRPNDIDQQRQFFESTNYGLDAEPIHWEGQTKFFAIDPAFASKLQFIQALVTQIHSGEGDEDTQRISRYLGDKFSNASVGLMKAKLAKAKQGRPLSQKDLASVWQQTNPNKPPSQMKPGDVNSLRNFFTLAAHPQASRIEGVLARVSKKTTTNYDQALQLLGFLNKKMTGITPTQAQLTTFVRNVTRSTKVIPTDLLQVVNFLNLASHPQLGRADALLKRLSKKSTVDDSQANTLLSMLDGKRQGKTIPQSQLESLVKSVTGKTTPIPMDLLQVVNFLNLAGHPHFDAAEVFLKDLSGGKPANDQLLGTLFSFMDRYKRGTEIPQAELEAFVKQATGKTTPIPRDYLRVSNFLNRL